MQVDLSKEIVTEHDGLPKVLVIDDEEEVGEMLAITLRSAKCQTVIVTDPKEVLPAIKTAVAEGTPFSAATVDIRFDQQVGKNVMSLYRGPQLISEIKAEFPQIGCLIVTGEPITPSQALDLRDEFGVDYIYFKDRLEPNEFARAVKRAVDRAAVVMGESNVTPRADGEAGAGSDTVTPGTTAVSVSKSKLRQVLIENFSEQELRELCFDMDLNYEELSGTSIREKALQLLTYFDRRDRLKELIEVCFSLRPNAFQE